MQKQILLILLTLAAATMQAQVANTTALADTTRGFALILMDDATNPDALPALQLARVYSLPAQVNVNTNTPQGQQIDVKATATIRLYFWPDGRKIPTDDVLVFKKRPWKK